MLIDYAIRAEEYLSGAPVSESDWEAYYQDQRRFFEAMGIIGWEEHLTEYRENREKELEETLQPNDHTDELFQAYRKDLGGFRYTLLLWFMGHFLPDPVRRKLGLTRHGWFTPVYRLYPVLHGTVFAKWIRMLLLPPRVRSALG